MNCEKCEEELKEDREYADLCDDCAVEEGIREEEKAPH